MKKAKISYTIDFDSVPNEINKMLGVEFIKDDKLYAWFLSLRNIISQGNIFSSIKEIDLIRQHLYDIDLRLSETQQILKDYDKEISKYTDIPDINKETDG